jgi:hypothetical protein
MTPAFDRPAWSAKTSSRYTGRYPLAVESFALARVAELLPGVTTVTPHARYFSLHAFVAVESEQRRLDSDARLDLLRRCEVVVAAITTLHFNAHPGSHAGLPAGHGADVINAAMSSGTLQVGELAKPGQYAESPRGFLGPYLASERTLGLVTDYGSAIGVGEQADRGQLRRGFAGLVELADQDSIPVAELRDRPELCACGEAAAERAWLRSRLVPSPPMSGSDERRAQSTRLFCRLIELHHPVDLTREAGRALIGHEATFRDPAIERLEVTAAWRGVILRSWYVGAWRSLWSWIVNGLTPAQPVERIGDTLAAELPDQPLRAFVDDLPEAMAGEEPTDAEFDESITSRSGEGHRAFARLLIGAQRVGRLPDHVADYFEDAHEERRNRQLTPSSWSEWLHQRQHVAVADVARQLSTLLLQRSQRVALVKGRFRADGWSIPTRVAVLDGRLITDSYEPGGGISLRWETFAQVLTGLGLLRWTESGWALREDAG